MADIFVIEGGQPLRGTVTVNGAKNSATKLLAATLLAPGRARLGRVPRVAEVATMSDVCNHLGVDVAWSGDHELTVDVPDRLGAEAPYEPVRKMRASTAVLGPLVARTGKARVALPGGCNLGHRGIDLHVKGLEALGADIEVVHGYLEASAPRLVGTRIRLDYPSHGATETLLMAACLAGGTTLIECASREPEICDLADFLRSMGARISGDGSSAIEVEGVEAMKPASHEVMPDRLEAGTYLFATLAASGDVEVEGMVPEHLDIVLEKLSECGAQVDVAPERVRIRSEGRARATDVSTLPYPGFPTDLHPLMVAVMARADGLSIITENIFDGRFMYIDELARMGADVRTEGHYIVIRGAERLTGAAVRASDLRAGAALVVAGLGADGWTAVENVAQIDRGYESLEGRLSALGARIRRVAAGELVDV